MGADRNLVKKPKKDANDFDDDEIEDIDVDDDTSYKSKGPVDEDLKGKVVKLMIAIGAMTVVLILVLWIASLVSGSRVTYEDVEGIMSDAAKGYFADHQDYLPKNDGDVVEVDVANLVAEGRMKDLSKYFGEGVCTGSVQVEKTGADYLYTPYLNCGNEYQSIELFQKVLEDNPVTKDGEGLYTNENVYAFRGENVNNFVKLKKSLWRIVKIESDGNVVLILNEGIVNYKPWDDRFNEEKNYEAGVNNYNVSRVKDYLAKLYKSDVEFDNEKVLSARDRARMVSYDVCIGKRSMESTSKNNTEECRQKAANQKMGLLTLSDYLFASLDASCRNAASKSCTNYNYLTKLDDEWWLATASTDNNYEVYKVDRWGIIQVDTASTYSQVRPVIHLNSKVMYKSGKGTEKSPYKVK